MREKIFWVLKASLDRPGQIAAERVSGTTGSVLANHGWRSLADAATDLEARGFFRIDIGESEAAMDILEVWASPI